MDGFSCVFVRTVMVRWPAGCGICTQFVPSYTHVVDVGRVDEHVAVDRARRRVRRRCLTGGRVSVMVFSGCATGGTKTRPSRAECGDVACVGRNLSRTSRTLLTGGALAGAD